MPAARDTGCGRNPYVADGGVRPKRECQYGGDRCRRGERVIRTIFIATKRSDNRCVDRERDR